MGFFRSVMTLAIFTATMVGPVLSIPQPEAEVVDLLPRHEEGVYHLGHDGVLRSYDAEGSVTGYDRLDPVSIDIRLTRAGVGAEIRETFVGVDGRTVTDETALRNPPAWLRPNFSANKDRRGTDPGAHLFARAGCNAGCTKNSNCVDPACRLCVIYSGDSVGLCDQKTTPPCKGCN